MQQIKVTPFSFVSFLQWELDLWFKVSVIKADVSLQKFFWFQGISLLVSFPYLFSTNVLIQLIFSKPFHALLMLFQVTEWPVGNRGLLYDRNWMVVNQNGVCITQKQEPKLCLINPSIDLKQKIMVIQAEGKWTISFFPVCYWCKTHMQRHLCTCTEILIATYAYQLNIFCYQPQVKKAEAGIALGSFLAYCWDRQRADSKSVCAVVKWMLQDGNVIW